MSLYAWVRIVPVLLVLGLFGDTAREHGRRGNAQFEAEQFAEAEAAYRKGLTALGDTTGSSYVALQNNLGLALRRQGALKEARVAFRRARRAATTDSARVRVLFNAATVAAAMDDRTAALRDYRRVLLLNPSHETARYNYEYLKRDQQEESTSPPRRSDVEPSAYARQLRRRAETMVAERQYEAALNLMKEGVQRDSTVRAYRAFISRLEKVAQIDRTQP